MTERNKKMENVSEDNKKQVIDGLLNSFADKVGKPLEETSNIKE